MKQLKTAKVGYILISIAFYISGFCCIVRPDLMGENGKTVAGILLIAYGIIKMIGYFSKDLYCLAFQYDLACGIFLIVLGVITLCIKNYKGVYLLEGLGILFFSVLSGVAGIMIVIGKNLLIAGIALLMEAGMRHYIVHCTVKTDLQIL